EGMRELVALRDRAVTAWADSEYNASILRAAGYPDVHVLPIIVDMSRLEMAPDPVFERQWRSSQYTWAFIGRVSPNKRHENIIRAYACYKKHIHPHSRLLLIGENRNCWRYTQAMVDRVRSVGVGDVHFTGMVDDAELVAAYRMADVFVCMSEHEGFCVPLLEAMHFDLPVLAYRAGAVPETMGGAGVLLNTRDPVVIAELVEQLRVDTGFRRSVIDGQRRRLAVFRAMDLTGCVRDLLEGMIR
ncbi:glycosyltransferase, partial [bacterium]|nr:glycosyltransferase [candidate division CSSED10-310 bacterium]